MPKPTGTKRERALQHLERAREEVCQALSLLGGATRYKPKQVTNTYTARQYCESIDQRLTVTLTLVQNPEGPLPLLDQHITEEEGQRIASMPPEPDFS